MIKAVSHNGFGPVFGENKPAQVNLKNIQLKDTKGIFILFLIGSFIGIVAYIIEVLFNSITN